MNPERKHPENERPTDPAGAASDDTELSRRQADEDAARADNDGYPFGRRGDDDEGERPLAGAARTHPVASSGGADGTSSIGRDRSAP